MTFFGAQYTSAMSNCWAVGVVMVLFSLLLMLFLLPCEDRLRWLERVEVLLVVPPVKAVGGLLLLLLLLGSVVDSVCEFNTSTNFTTRCSHDRKVLDKFAMVTSLGVNAGGAVIPGL
jgi:hypothetical protein